MLFRSRLIADMKNIVNAEIYYRMNGFESEDEFNDMGLMQALDIVSTTICAIYEIINKGYVFNTNRIVLFGTSHGSYLAHLANVICPTLYTGLLDVSSYIVPYYLTHYRNLTIKTDKITWTTIYEYLIMKEEKYRYNDNLYNLSFLYQNIKNKCKIIALQIGLCVFPVALQFKDTVFFKCLDYPRNHFFPDLCISYHSR